MVLDPVIKHSLIIPSVLLESLQGLVYGSDHQPGRRTPDSVPAPWACRTRRPQTIATKTRLENASNSKAYTVDLPDVHFRSYTSGQNAKRSPSAH